jgi:hypothetical protein
VPCRARGASLSKNNLKCMKGLPAFSTHKVPALYPFGHGLSYASFAYSNLTVAALPVDGSARERRAAQLRAVVTVENTGGWAMLLLWRVAACVPPWRRGACACL